MNDFNEIKDTLVSLDEQRLLQLVKDALENGIPAGDILNKGLIAGMDIVGEKMENEDIAPEEFVRMIKGKNANILCLSALLTTTMPMMKQTIDAVVESGLRDQVKIMVGGAPVTQAFANDIGADAFASDAGSAAKTAKALIN